MSPLTSDPLSGFAAAQAALETRARSVARSAAPDQRPPPPPPPPSPAIEKESLSADMVGLVQAKSEYLAQMAVFRADDLMAGKLLDVEG